MKTTKYFSRFSVLRAACWLALLPLVLAPASQAATATKQAAGTDLTGTTAGVWAGGGGQNGSPTNVDVATWTGTSLGSGLTLAASKAWGGISVNGVATDIGITGAGILTNGASGIDLSASTVNLTLGIPVALGANQTWNVNAGKTLAASGIISGAGFGLAKAGAGLLSLSGANTYTGATTVSGGELDIANWGATGLGAITVGNASAPATLGISAGTLALGANTFTIGSGTTSSFVGTVNQTGGTVSFTSGTAMLLGNGTNTVANYNLSGGTLSSGTFSSSSRGVILGVNNGCSATFNLSGSGVLSLPYATLEVGRSDSAATGGTVVFSQTGGSATLGYLTLGGYSGAGGTTATLNLTGGSFVATNFPIFVGAANSSATLNLGGSAQVTLPAFPAPVGTANLTFNFTNGYLAPAAASANYLNGLANVYLTTNGANFNVGSGKNITIGQALQNAPAQAGRLTKSGAGILLLSGVSPYSGATTISAGELVGVTGGSLANSSVAVTPTTGVATLGVNYLGTNGQWSCSNLTFNPGGTGVGMEFAFAATPSLTTAPLNIAGSLTFNATPTITVDPANLVAGTAYPLLTVGGTAPSVGVPTTANIGRGLTGTLAWGTGSPYSTKTLVLTVSGAATEPLNWSTSATGIWDNNDVTNLVWKDSATPTPNAAYYQDSGLLGDAVVFSDNGIAANTIVTLNTTVAPASVTVNNTNYSYTLSGSGGIIGSTALTKTGTGALTLSTANTYSGGTLINQGSVSTGVANGLGTAPVNIASGATLNLTAGGVTYTGPNAGISGAGTVNITTGSGSSAVPLNGANTGFTGVLNIGTNSTGGKVQLYGQLASSATVNVLSNSTVYMFGNTEPAAITLFGGTPGEVYGQLRLDSGANWAGPVTLAGPVLSATVGHIGGNSGIGYITGNIGQTGGAQALVKIGAATTVLSGLNTYTGPNIVNGGALTLLGNQTGATGGFYIGTNTAVCYLNIGLSTQTSNTTATVAAGNNVVTASAGTSYSSITATGTNGYPTFVTNNGTLSTGRDSGFTVSAFANWFQNGPLTVQANGGYPANFVIAANGNFTYAGPALITNSAPGSSGSTSLSIAGQFTTAQGFYFNDSGSTGYPQLTLASGGSLTLSANVSQLITSGGSGPVGKFFLGTNGVINTAGFNTAEGFVIANAAGQIGSLIKSGAGTLELDAVNTYTGPTIIAGGTLALGPSASLASTALVLTNNGTLDVSQFGNYTINVGQALVGSGSVVGNFSDTTGTPIYPGGNGPIGTLSFASTLTLAGGDTLYFDFSNGGSNDVINASALSLNGNTTINLANWPLPSGFAVGNYVLFQVTNGINGSAANFTLANAPGRQNCQLVINNLGAVQQVVLSVGQSGAPANLFWLGGDGNAWDVQSTTEWLNNGSADYFYSGDHVTFSNVPTANTAVTLAVPVAPGAVVFASTNNYVLASGAGGYITGITALTQNGPGSVTLATANDYSGGTTIAGGVLQLGDGVGNNGSILGPVLNNAALVVANPVDETLSNNISGSGSVTAAGPGVLTLVGNNTYTGGLTINNNATIIANTITALGAPVATNAATIGTNGLLKFNVGTSLVLSNTLIGAGAVAQTGASALTLLGTNTFSGGVTINLGAVYAASSAALGTGPITINNLGAGAGSYSQLFLKNGVNLTNAITIVSGASYYQGVLMADAGNYGYGGANGSGTATDTNGATFSGPITFAPGTIQRGGSFCGPLGGTNWLYLTGPIFNTNASISARNGRVQFSGGGDYATLSVAQGISSIGANNGLSTNAVLGVAGSGTASFDFNGFSQTLAGLSSGTTYAAFVTNSSVAPTTLTLNLNAANTYNGILAGKLNLIVTGSGLQFLAGTNNYSGNTTVNGGTLEIAQPTIATNSTVTVAAGAVLQLDFAATNPVVALVLNGVNQPPGVYDSTTAAPYLTGAGSLVVASSIATTPTSITFSQNGNNLNLTWPADHLGWLVQSNSVNLTVPGDWFDISGSDAATSYSITLDASKPSVFYRLRKP